MMVANSCRLRHHALLNSQFSISLLTVEDDGGNNGIRFVTTTVHLEIIFYHIKSYWQHQIYRLYILIYGMCGILHKYMYHGPGKTPKPLNDHICYEKIL